MYAFTSRSGLSKLPLPGMESMTVNCVVGTVTVGFSVARVEYWAREINGCVGGNI